MTELEQQWKVLNREGLRFLGEQEYQNAALAFKAGVDFSKEELGAQHPYTAVSLTNLALVLELASGYEDAVELLEQALLIEREHFGSRDLKVAKTLSNIGAVLKRKGDISNAKERLVEAVEIHREKYGRYHEDSLPVLYNLAEVYHLTGEKEQEQKLSEEIRAIETMV